MKTILKILLTAIAVLAIASFLSGVYVENYGTAIWVAIALALLRFTVKPVLILLTLPLTIVTFGLFLLIINALIIELASYFVSGFEVVSIWWAILFSLLLSFFQSLMFAIFEREK